MRKAMGMTLLPAQEAPRSTEERVPRSWLSFVAYQASGGWTVVTKERTFWGRKVERWYRETSPGVWEVSETVSKGRRKTLRKESRRESAWLPPLIERHGHEGGVPRTLRNARRYALPAS